MKTITLKKIICSLGFSLLCIASIAQSGLENIIVEKYYVSNANDTTVNSTGGILPVGSVTYRIYADMLPGYKFQAAYGVPGHELRFATTTSFFNNADRGATTPTYSKAQAAGNTVMLDSWVTAGAACTGNFGVLKTEDDGVANVVNADGVLQNNDASAGIPLTTQDGLLAGSPVSVTTIGITAQLLAVFNNVSGAGNLFSTTNGSWAALGGATGPTAANRVLIAQVTTNGCFTFELNLQIGTPTGGVQNFVARNPVGNEIKVSSLLFNTADVSIAPNPTGIFCSGTNVTFTATPVSGGTTPSYQWKKNGINTGTNSPTYSSFSLVDGDEISCVMTSNATCVVGSPVTSNTIKVSVTSTPVLSSFSPASGPWGTEVTINGSGFTGVTSVKFNGLFSAFTIINDQQIRATAPYPASTGNIIVGGICGSASSATPFIIPFVQGLEGIIVEKYYISNANDTAVNSTGGILPVGSVTYRIYADLLPGFNFQAAYGVPNHELRMSTSTTFFNNQDRGATTPTYTKAQAANNTVMLDSWVSAGAACVGNYGILKSEDNSVSNVVNTDNVLLNNDPQAGIPLTTQDGLFAGTPKDVTLVGINSALTAVFGSTAGAGNLFTTSSGSWAAFGGATGPDTRNRVLIAQVTTDGCFSFQLNLQVGAPGGAIQNYVAKNPTGNEISIPGLSYNVATVTIAASPSGPVCTGTSVVFTATPVNGGTTPAYQWKKNGLNVGTNSSVYTDSALSNNDLITCIMTSNATCVTGNPATSNSISTQVINCTANLNLKLYLQGYYTGFGSSTPMDNSGSGGCLYTDAQIDGFSANPEDVDSVFISLVDPTILANTGDVVASTFETSSGILKTDGTLAVTFSGASSGHNYYIKVEQRNHLETWSALPVPVTSVTSYDFTTSFTQAYEFDGNSFHGMFEVEPGKWAMYVGDIFRDGTGFVDILDIPELASQIEGVFPFGYQSGDMNGDGFIDILDIPLLTSNVEYSGGVYSQHP